MKKLIACALSLFCLAGYAATERPVVKMATGQLQGIVEHGMQAFKGIPFAAPPVGDLRWRPPQPALAWSGVRDAGKFGPACVQPSIKNLSTGLDLPGSEDCLHLNVFRPDSTDQKLPVMVWIHGGGMMVDAARDPQFMPVSLVKNGVIVVTIDYRLGPFGFFATQELIDEAKAKGEPVGNYGTMDQIAALKWVKNNIAAFGGNPDNVTIFGQSAGGRSVTWLMVSEPARGLFHKAIAQSAQQSPLRGMTKTFLGLPPATEIAAKYMESRGAKSLAELRSLPTAKLELQASDFSSGVFAGPFIDGRIIPGDPIPMFASGKQAKVPFMIGTNSFDSDWMLPGEPTLEDYLKKVHENPEVIKQLYASVKDQCILNSFVMQDMLYPASAKLLANHMQGLAPSYMYYFDYLTKNIRPAFPGAPHTYEIAYVFGSLDFLTQAPAKVESGANQCERIMKDIAEFKKENIWPKDWYPIVDKNDPDDKQLSEKMSASWAAFARTGNPNVPGQANWPTYDLKSDVMRNYADGNQTIQGLLKERLDYHILHLREIYAVQRLEELF
jgi:para-nitrobenzyl esterase